MMGRSKTAVDLRQIQMLIAVTKRTSISGILVKILRIGVAVARVTST